MYIYQKIFRLLIHRRASCEESRQFQNNDQTPALVCNVQVIFRYLSIFYGHYRYKRLLIDLLRIKRGKKSQYSLVKEQIVSVKNPTLIPTSHWKDDPDPVVADSEPLVASSMRVFCARNSQREVRSRPREGREHLFQWDVGISVGFSTGTTGSLRYPRPGVSRAVIYMLYRYRKGGIRNVVRRQLVEVRYSRREIH